MFKKFRLFLLYTSILKKNKELLKTQHGISIDFVWRMYKTYSIPENEKENIKKLGFAYFNTLLKKEISAIDKTFISTGLSELASLMEAVELNDTQVGLAFRFKYFDTKTLVSRFLWLIFSTFMGLIGFFSLSFLGLTVGLFISFILYIISRFI
jgi:hypothetical protein